MFYADLHIHSKYSRACSRDCDLEHLAWWAARKGISVVGTGDFTHPAWAQELADKLVPAEPGLWRLRPEIEEAVGRTLPLSCRRPVRFLLSVEISTIYKRADRTRKVHHLIYTPTLAAAQRVTTALGKIGNLTSDGRPILGLDSRDLLDITLESDPGSYLVPAHVWTPWFSVLGSKSGFDTVTECYADLADHIFAIETGLSSDPPMNWTCSTLDRYRLVSNSDAHSPPALGREATAFDTDLDYHALRRALETGVGFAGTVEFFPEEGKYHLDGHRKCGVRLVPEETRAQHGNCPQCGRSLTVGVLHRVTELADRPVGARPEGASAYRNLIPLPEIVGEILRVGPKSKKVTTEISRLVAALGPELSILTEVPTEDAARSGGSLLGEALDRLRRGAVLRDSGYDGEYGAITVFAPGELAERPGQALFDLPEPAPPLDPPRSAAVGAGSEGPGKHRTAAPLHDPTHDPKRPEHPTDLDETPSGAPAPRDHPGAEDQHATSGDTAAAGVVGGLDPEQRAAATVPYGPLVIIAGPGTGKTRTLTHRIAHLVIDRGVPPDRCLALTFTRRAAAEMRERLAALLPDRVAEILVTTFHGLGARVLRERAADIGLPRVQVADEPTRLRLATEVTGSAAAGRRLLARPAGDPAAHEAYEAYGKALHAAGLVDFDGLVALPVRLLTERPEIAAGYRDRWRWIFVDEYQDVDETQYALLRLLAGSSAGGDRPALPGTEPGEEPPGTPGGTDRGLTVIGDPDQAIYGFRGADVRFFLRFAADFPAAAQVALHRNYRSSPAIVTAAVQAIAPATLVPGRTLIPATEDPAAPAAITVHEARDERDEAAFIAGEIGRLLGGLSLTGLDGRAAAGAHDRLSLADIAVLYRTDAQAGPIMAALDRAGLPYQKRSHDRLVRRPGVAALAARMRRHLTGPLVDRLAAATRDALAEPTDPRGDAAAEVRAAAALLAPLARRCGDDLDRFGTELALGAEVDGYDPRADTVALLTLHAAKGLEFPVVFLAGVEDGLLPLRVPGGEPDLAEERRLFFVGITRARSRLVLSYAGVRGSSAGRAGGGRSPFLAAVDRALLAPTEPGPYGHRAGRADRRVRQLRLI